MAGKDKHLQALEDMIGQIGIGGVINRLGVIFGQIYQRGMHSSQHRALWKKIGNILYSASVRINALNDPKWQTLKPELFEVNDGEPAEPESTPRDQANLGFPASTVN